MLVRGYEHMGAKIQLLGDISLSLLKEKSEIKQLDNQINAVIGENDYCIANLESPFLLGEGQKIKKDGPNLSHSKEDMSFLQKLSIDGYTIANNHIGDFGECAIIDTIHYLEKINIDYVGLVNYTNYEYETLDLEIKEEKISIIAVCENEFGIDNDEIKIAGYNPKILYNTIKKKESEDRFCIVVFHGGTEEYPFPTPDCVDRYRLIIDYGANVVVGMHTHCAQGYEIYNSGLILYSLGNFLFPRDTGVVYDSWNIGYGVRLNIEQGKLLDFEMNPYRLLVGEGVFSSLDKDIFDNYLSSISKPLLDDLFLKEMYYCWASVRGEKKYKDIKIECMDETNVNVIIRNAFACETHNELLKTYLGLRIKGELEQYKSKFEDINHYFFKEERTLVERYDCFIWGVCQTAFEAEQFMKNKRYAFVDSDVIKQGRYIHDTPIFSPQEAISNNKKGVFIVTTRRKYYNKIKEWLLDNGAENIEFWEYNHNE